MLTPYAQLPSSPATEELSAQLDKKNPKAVAGQFESLFYRMMFEQLRMGLEEDPLMGNNEGQQIQAMFHDELANVMGAKGDLGIGDLMMKGMEREEKAVRGGLIKS